MDIDRAICTGGTSDIAIRVNIAIGEVKGINEQTVSIILSGFDEVSEYMTTKNAIMNIIVTGMTAVFMSSSFDTVDPIAPYMKA